MKTLGQFIREVRMSKMISLPKMSELTGITQDFIIEIERDSIDDLSCFGHELSVIAKALDLPDAFIAFYSLKRTDIHPDKQEIFYKIAPAMKNLIESVCI